MASVPRFLRLRFATTIAVLTTAGSVNAGVIVVDAAGGGDYVQIQAAVDAASDGDAILVKPGNYTTFTIDHKDLSVVGDGEPVTVSGGIVVRNTLEAHPVLLAGLESSGYKDDSGVVFPALSLHITRGPVRVEQCTLIGPDGRYCDWGCSPPDKRAGGEAVRIETGLDVCFTECTIRGGRGEVWFTGGPLTKGGEGILADGCSISLHDCTVQGGQGAEEQPWDLSEGGDGGDAVQAGDTASVGTIVHASGSAVIGGDGGDGDWCWDNGGTGGDGLHLVGPTAAGYVLDTTLVGGAPGCGFNNPPPGMPLRTEGGATAVLWAGTSRHLEVKTLAREKEVVKHTFLGEAGDLVFLLQSPSADFVLEPAFFGVMTLASHSPMRVLFMGAVPIGGALDRFVGMPDLPAGVESRRTYTLAVFRDVGGQAWLGSPSARLVVDSSL